MKKSKLLFGIYSYIRIFSSHSMQQPKSLARLLCWSLATSIASKFSPSHPWADLLESLFTTTKSPFSNISWNFFLRALFYGHHEEIRIAQLYLIEIYRVGIITDAITNWQCLFVLINMVSVKLIRVKHLYTATLEIFSRCSSTSINYTI